MSDTVTPSVHEALSAIAAELPGISKVPHPTQDGRGITYAYRGIEEITKEAQPLLAKYGVTFAPNVESCEIKDIIVNGNPWTDTILKVRYDIFGVTGDLLQVTTVGIGRDNSDKGANKAMTQAFKYALLQVFCIADGEDDADGTTVAADARVERHRTRLTVTPATSRFPPTAPAPRSSGHPARAAEPAGRCPRSRARRCTPSPGR